MWGRRKKQESVVDRTGTPSVDELAPLPDDIYADVDTHEVYLDAISTRLDEQAPKVREFVDSLTGHHVRNHFSERAIESMRLIDRRAT